MNKRYLNFDIYTGTASGYLNVYIRLRRRVFLMKGELPPYIDIYNYLLKNNIDLNLVYFN